MRGYINAYALASGAVIERLTTVKLSDFDSAPELRFSDDNYEGYEALQSGIVEVPVPSEEVLVAGKRFDDKVDMRGGFFFFPTVWLPETRTLVQGEYRPDEAAGFPVEWYRSETIPEGHPYIAYLEKNL